LQRPESARPPTGDPVSRADLSPPAVARPAGVAMVPTVRRAAARETHLTQRRCSVPLPQFDIAAPECWARF